MASVNQRAGKLFFDFRYRGVRCREYTKLPDTQSNRKKMEKILGQIESEIALGTFSYAEYFPSSSMLQKLEMTGKAREAERSTIDETPKFSDFAEDWKRLKAVEWRTSYLDSVEHILSRHLLPYFGDLHLSQIDRQRVLEFRTLLTEGKTPTRRRCAPATVNRVIGILSMILDEASYSHPITNPCKAIKRLKLQRTDIQPFTVEEMQLLVRSVREDYSDYLLVRFLTGMRTAEANGLKWECVDFDRREIRIRETWVNGRTEYTKTDGSQREIKMSEPVYQALLRMRARTGTLGSYVFCTAGGRPIDNHNFVSRVWKPLIRYLGLKDRRPYQMRHTCATLWLAAGENPEWIARQLGHTSTQMLFQTYSRYVPNLTRKDGSAFDRMVSGVIHGGYEQEAPSEPTRAGDSHNG